MEAQSTILAKTLATRLSRGCRRDRAQLLHPPQSRQSRDREAEVPAPIRR